MDDRDRSATPTVAWEESTGYLCLSDGRHRQIVCRREGGYIYLWWKRDRKEHRISLEEWRALFGEEDRTA